MRILKLPQELRIFLINFKKNGISVRNKVYNLFLFYFKCPILEIFALVLQLKLCRRSLENAVPVH